jgi:catechol 2,3-dioxygenase-like lactoylglutathione lyase family enzyme
MPEARPLISGGTPTVYVADLDRAIVFYTETLGLSLSMRVGNEYASIDAGQGFFVGLHPAGPESPTPGTPGATRVTFGVGQAIERVVETLAACGVEFPHGIVGDGPVKLAFFRDLDGNEMYLCEYGHAG